MNDPYRLVISPRAAAELEQIYDYIAKGSPQNARSVVARILDSLELLRVVPHRTELTPQQRGLKYPVRSLPVRPYVVYFRTIDEDKVIRVLRIRHGARRRLRRFE